MPASNSEQLILATLFTGKVDKRFVTIVRELKILLNGLNKVLNKAQKAGDNAARGIGRTNAQARKGKADMSAYQRAVVGVGTAFRRYLSTQVVSRSIMYLSMALRAGVYEVFAYDQALHNLQAITGATDREIEAMGDTIQDVATRTKFSTSEIGQGMVLLAQSGFDASESMLAMQDVADLATGTLSSMSTVSDLLTTSIRAFNLEASQSGRVADVMANAINKSKLTVDKLRIAFNFVGASASLAGVSLEETAASAMVLANNGIRASTIGTGLRQVLKRLIAPNLDLREAYEEAGIKLDEINPKTVGYQKVLLNLAKVLYDSKRDTINMSKAFELFGLRGAQAASILVKEYASGKFNKAIDFVYEVGTAARMASTQFDGLAVSLKNFKDIWGVLWTTISEAGLRDVFAGLLDTSRFLLSTLNDLGQTMGGKMVIQAGLLVGALGGLLVVVQSLMFIFTALQSAVGALGITVSLVNPITALIAVLSVVTVGVYNYTTALKNAGDAHAKEAVKLKGTITSLEVYLSALENLKEKSKDNKEAKKEYLSTLQRLVEEFPELTNKIELSTDAHEENLKIVKDLTSAQTKVRLKELTESINKYGKAAQRAALWVGIWNKFRIKGTVTDDQKKKRKEEISDLRKEQAERSKAVRGWLKETAGKVLITGGPLSEATRRIKETLDSLVSSVKKTMEEMYEEGKKSEKSLDFLALQAGGLKEIAQLYLDASASFFKETGKELSFDDWLKKNHPELLPENITKLGNLILEQRKIREKDAKDEAKRKALIAEKPEKKTDVRFEQLMTEANTRQQRILLRMNRRRKSAQASLRQDFEASLEGQDLTEKQKSLRWEMWLDKRNDLMVEHLSDMKKFLMEDEIEIVKNSMREFKNVLAEYKAIDPMEVTGEDDKKVLDKYTALKQKVEALIQTWADWKTLVETTPKEDAPINKLAQSFDAITIKTDKVKKDVKDMGDGWKNNLTEIGESLVSDIGDNLTDIGDKTKNVRQQFEDMARDMLKDISALILKWLIFRALMGVSGGIGGSNVINEFAKTGLSNLGFGGYKVASKGVSSVVKGITPSTDFLPTVNSRMVANPASGLNTRSVSEQSNNNSAQNFNYWQVSAVDGPSFYRMLSDKGAQQVIIKNIINNKQHNGMIRRG